MLCKEGFDVDQVVFFFFSDVRALLGVCMLSYQRTTCQPLQRTVQLKQGEEG